MIAPHSVDKLSVAFPQNFEAAQLEFDQISQRTLHLNSHNKQIQIAPSLDIQTLWIPSPGSQKLLILSSGIHGPESFAGSALQTLTLQKILRDKNKFPFNILFLHGINPYGFKNFRRTNSQNVDLNRNFVVKDEFLLKNQNFESLNNTLHKHEAANLSWINQIIFYLKIAGKSLIYGKKSILGALSGQYSHPKALYYGGQSLQHETQAVIQLLKERIANMDSILHIDLHTGFGEKGKLHYFGSDEFNSPEQLKMLAQVFPKAKINTAQEKDFYKTHGDFIDWTWKSFPGKKIIPMVFEFGTLDSQTLSGGMLSLWTCVVENQGFHHGYATTKDEALARQLFENLFNPQEYLWQQKVLDQGSQALDESLQNFLKL